MQIDFIESAAKGISNAVYAEISDLSKDDDLQFQDNNGALTNKTAVQNSPTFSTSGSNLVISLTTPRLLPPTRAFWTDLVVRAR